MHDRSPAGDGQTIDTATFEAAAHDKAAVTRPAALEENAFALLACPVCSMTAGSMATFCSHCGTRLRGTLQALGGGLAERRQVTIVFCDLVGSAALAAEHDVEDVAEVMRLYHATVGRVMDKFGGYVARPIGDGGLFYFGYPTASEDDSRRAVEAALVTLAEIARLPLQLGAQMQIRIGISSGVVVVSNMLEVAERGGNDVIGDAANLAARLQQFAAPGQILVTDAVHATTRAMFDYDDGGRVALRGWSNAVQVWQVKSAIPYAGRFDVRLTSDLPLLVGRAAERAVLQTAWEQTVAGIGKAVLLVGEPGIGKSRLAQELTHSVVPPGTVQRRCFCAAMQQNVALYPLIEELTYTAGLSSANTAATRLHKLSSVLTGAPDEDITLLAELVAPGTAAGRPSVQEASPGRQRARILDALLGIVLRQAAAAPLVVLVEDAHWIDPTSAEFLARLVAAVAGHQLLLLVTARPQFRPEWAGRADVLHLELDPLSPDYSARLVRAAFGASQLADDLVADIVARTDGVALYIEEVTRSVTEHDASAPSVPASLQASLQGRIDRLGPSRRLAETASAIGRAFDLPLLAVVCGATAAELQPEVQRLVDSGFLVASTEAGRTSYSFRHALICEATYGTVIRERRRAMHSRIAEAIEQHFAADAVAQPQILALHYTAGGLDRPAAMWWLRAGLQSLQRFAITEALAQLRRALALIEKFSEGPDRDRLELEVLVVYGKALIATQGHAAEATGAVFARARILCDVLGNPPQLLTVLFVQWTHAYFRVRAADAEAQAQDLLRRAEQRDDDIWLVMGCYTLGITRFLHGRNNAAIDLLRHGVVRFDPARRHLYAGPTIGDPRVVMRIHLQWSLMLRGSFAESRREVLAAVSESRELRQPWVLALALSQQVYAALWLNGPAAATPLLDELEQVSSSADYHAAIAMILRGWLQSARSDPAAGLQTARAGRSRLMALGAGLNAPQCLRAEAAMLLQLGRTAEALESLEAGKALQIQTGQHWDDAEFHRQRGEILLAIGQPERAERELRAALCRSREENTHLCGLRAAIPLARQQAESGQPAAAAALLQAARLLVEDDPSILDVAAADALLRQLGATE